MNLSAAVCHRLCGLALFLCTLPTVADDRDDQLAGYLATASLLAPIAAEWLSLTEAPTLTAAELAAQQAALVASYRAAVRPGLWLERDCSFIERALGQSANADHFRRIDLDRDGDDEVVYVGSAQCQEGEATVIWYASDDGFRVDAPAAWPLRLLAVGADSPHTLSVAPGCCGAITDTFSFGQLDNLRAESDITVLQGTTLPAARASAREFVARDELVLRATPEINDDYQPGFSELMNRAVLGNIVRKYLADSRGVVLAEQRIAGKTWWFVRMPADSNLRVSHDPYDGVRAGWVLSQQTQ